MQGEPRMAVGQVIKNAKNFGAQTQYGGGAVAFQFAQVSNCLFQTCDLAAIGNGSPAAIVLQTNFDSAQLVSGFVHMSGIPAETPAIRKLQPNCCPCLVAGHVLLLAMLQAS